MVPKLMTSIVGTGPHSEEANAGSGRAKQQEILRFQNVSVRFDEKTALNNVSFKVTGGETVVLCGATTSGKTVLLKTAIGLIRPAEGDVFLLEQNIVNRQEEELYPLRRSTGVLFQEGALFDSLTVLENVAYPLSNPPDRKLPDSDVEARAKEALGFVGLKAVEEKFPSDLSGGMRRRVGIARAIVARPSLILYDSPTAGLDPITAYRIMALVIQQRDTWNTTSIVVTHRHQDGYLLANYRYDPRNSRPIKAGDARPHTSFVILREGHMVFKGSEEEMRASTDPYTARFAGRRTIGEETK
jgi:phospholipid/cholesterol/gamma-HCH transport system ATP-binding protein